MHSTVAPRECGIGQYGWGRREGEREGGREGEREGGKEGGKEREVGREGGREGGREAGREGGREGRAVVGGCLVTTHCLSHQRRKLLGKARDNILVVEIMHRKLECDFADITLLTVQMSHDSVL